MTEGFLDGSFPDFRISEGRQVFSEMFLELFNLEEAEHESKTFSKENL